MLTLDKRPCRIGFSINTRREMHGEEAVPAMDVPLTNILLKPGELADLLDEPGAYAALFDTGVNPHKPIFHEKLRAFAMSGKFKGAHVVIHVGMAPDAIVLENVKLSKLKLAPQIGGLTALNLTVQVSGEIDELTQLLHFLDSSADVEIEFPEGASEEDEVDEEQNELDLEHA